MGKVIRQTSKMSKAHSCGVGARGLPLGCRQLRPRATGEPLHSLRGQSETEGPMPTGRRASRVHCKSCAVTSWRGVTAAALGVALRCPGGHWAWRLCVWGRAVLLHSARLEAALLPRAGCNKLGRFRSAAFSAAPVLSGCQQALVLLGIQAVASEADETVLSLRTLSLFHMASLSYARLAEPLPSLAGTFNASP